jgi:hypothetical protein
MRSTNGSRSRATGSSPAASGHRLRPPDRQPRRSAHGDRIGVSSTATLAAFVGKAAARIAATLDPIPGRRASVPVMKVEEPRRPHGAELVTGPFEPVRVAAGHDEVSSGGPGLSSRLQPDARGAPDDHHGLQLHPPRPSTTTGFLRTRGTHRAAWPGWFAPLPTGPCSRHDRGA